MLSHPIELRADPTISRGWGDGQGLTFFRSLITVPTLIVNGTEHCISQKQRRDLMSKTPELIKLGWREVFQLISLDATP